MTPRQVIEGFYDRIWNRLEKTAVPDLIYLHYIFCGLLGPTMTGHAAFSTYVGAVTQALADYRARSSPW